MVTYVPIRTMYYDITKNGELSRDKKKNIISTFGSFQISTEDSYDNLNCNF